MRCLFFKHEYTHIANFTDIRGGRGLYQCVYCKSILISGPSEFFRDRETLEDGYNFDYRPRKD